MPPKGHARLHNQDFLKDIYLATSSAPECPKEDLTLETIIIISVLTLFAYMHHRHQKKKKRKSDPGCKVED